MIIGQTSLLESEKLPYQSIIYQDQMMPNSLSMNHSVRNLTQNHQSFHQKAKILVSAQNSHSTYPNISQISGQVKVFPDILKTTHQNMKQFKRYEMLRIDDSNIKGYYQAKTESKLPSLGHKIQKSATNQNDKHHLHLRAPIQVNPTQTILSLITFQPSADHNELSELLRKVSPKDLKNNGTSLQKANPSSERKRVQKLNDSYQTKSLDTFRYIQDIKPSDNPHWKVKGYQQKLNKAYYIQQQSIKDKGTSSKHIETVERLIQKKIILNGENIKTGTRKIFILYFAEDQYGEKHLKIQQFHLPIYKKILKREEINQDFEIFKNLLSETLKLGQRKIQFFFLDGRAMNYLNLVPSFEKFLYMNIRHEENQFDFWKIMKKNLRINGKFKVKKYHILVMRMYDLKTLDEVQRYFLKRENFSIVFHQQEEELKNQVILILVNIKKQTIQSEDIDIEIEEKFFDKSIFHMNPLEQEAFIQTIQRSLNKQKSKYSRKLINEEECLRGRIEKIKQQRQSIEMKSIKSLNGQSRSVISLKDNEQEQFERILLDNNQESLQEIQEYAEEQVNHDGGQNLIARKMRHQYVFSRQKNLIQYQEDISDPFLLLNEENNKKYFNILKFVNIEKIMIEKNLSRQDVINYLSVFKSLMDSDILPKINNQQVFIYVSDESKEDHRNSFNSTVPKLYITLKQLRRALPYLALYKPVINTKKLNEIYSKKYNCVGFMDFLDIFASKSEEVLESEVLDNDAFM